MLRRFLTERTTDHGKSIEVRVLYTPLTSQPRDLAMTTDEFLVQKAGLVGANWTTVCRAAEAKAREIYQRQLKLYSIGRFRLLDGSGNIIEEGKATPLFSSN
jgi:hypothetical protein